MARRGVLLKEAGRPNGVAVTPPRFRAWRRALAATLGAVMLLSATAAMARGEPVRGDAVLSSSDGYARLILKFADEVPTEVVVSGAVLVIRFQKPVDLPTDKLSDAVPSYVGSVRRDPDGMAIRLALAQKVTVNMMTAGERVFVDLLPESWRGLPPGLPAVVVRELAERALAAEKALRLKKTMEDAQARPPVRVRASVLPTLVRYVFELPDGVSASSSLTPQKLTISFTSALVFDLADAKVAAPSNVKSIDQSMEGDNSAVSIALIGDVDVRSFREEKTFVVDIGFDQAKALPLGAVAPEKSSEAKPSEVKALDANPPVATTPAVNSTREATVAAKPDKAPVAPAERETPTPVNEARAPAPPEAKAPSVPATETAQPAATSPADLIVPVIRRSSDELRLTFAFEAATPVALFRRSDAIWMVFDSAKPIDAKTIERDGAAVVSQATQFALPQGQALRLKLRRPQFASLSGDDRTVALSLADTLQSPSQPLIARRDVAGTSGANIIIALAGAGQLHRLTDPDAGDALMVVTAAMPPRGVLRMQNFVELALLESAQGIVVQPRAEDITVDVAADRVVLTQPGGLTLSKGEAASPRSAKSSRALFDNDEWRNNQRADFLERRSQLMNAAAQASGDKQIDAHLDFALFFMARGLYSEAKGILDVVLAQKQFGEDDMTALVVHAVASTLAGREDLAVAELANPAIGSELLPQLWKALIDARQQKWADAREKFKNMEGTIVRLPVDLQRIVLADALRASLEVKDYSGAASRLDDLDTIGVAPDQVAAVMVMRGWLAEALGRDSDAMKLFHDAAATANGPAAAEAKFLEVALGRKRGEMSDDDAIRTLETLGVTWRGDMVEVRTLNMLGRLYADKGRYGDAFAIWRVAIKLQSQSDIARQSQDDALALFSQLFLTQKGDDLPAIEALGMFYEYRDLTPIGRRGDEMIRRLADRLIAVDLLDQAGDLLQYQVDRRLEGAARAQVAARLAMIYLMNHKPDRAIGALRSTRITDLAGELRQQRLLLEARAQSDIGRHDLALEIISNLNGREAVRLRSDIYWAQRRWRESAEQIELLLGERWRDFQPLTVTEKGDIIRAVVGYALAEDGIGLSRFREKYASRMTSADDRAVFDVAGKPASANSAEFAKIAKMAAAIDTLDGFLDEMKARFPESVARARPAADMTSTGALPAIVGKKVQASR